MSAEFPKEGPHCSAGVRQTYGKPLGNLDTLRPPPPLRVRWRASAKRLGPRAGSLQDLAMVCSPKSPPELYFGNLDESLQDRSQSRSLSSSLAGESRSDSQACPQIFTEASGFFSRSPTDTHTCLARVRRTHRKPPEILEMPGDPSPPSRPEDCGQAPGTHGQGACKTSQKFPKHDPEDLLGSLDESLQDRSQSRKPFLRPRRGVQKQCPARKCFN